MEVIIALAVFGFVVTGLMAFLPWAIDGKANIKDFNTACAMPDAVQIELERIAELVRLGLIGALVALPELELGQVFSHCLWVNYRGAHEVGLRVRAAQKCFFNICLAG